MVGLRKIDEATEQLIILNEQLEIQKVVVAEKTLACEIILQEISEGNVETNINGFFLNIVTSTYKFLSTTLCLYC